MPIKNNAFSNCSSLSYVFFPDSVTSIGNSFFGCPNLKEVELPAGAEYLDWTFGAGVIITFRPKG